MDIHVEPILYEQKSVFIQMLELYLYDFSEFSNDDINEYGYFGYGHIDSKQYICYQNQYMAL